MSKELEEFKEGYNTIQDHKGIIVDKKTLKEWIDEDFKWKWNPSSTRKVVSECNVCKRAIEFMQADGVEKEATRTNFCMWCPHIFRYLCHYTFKRMHELLPNGAEDRPINELDWDIMDQIRQEVWQIFDEYLETIDDDGYPIENTEE